MVFKSSISRIVLVENERRGKSRDDGDRLFSKKKKKKEGAAKGRSTWMDAWPRVRTEGWGDFESTKKVYLERAGDACEKVDEGMSWVWRELGGPGCSHGLLDCMHVFLLQRKEQWEKRRLEECREILGVGRKGM